MTWVYLSPQAYLHILQKKCFYWYLIFTHFTYKTQSSLRILLYRKVCPTNFSFEHSLPPSLERVKRAGRVGGSNLEQQLSAATWVVPTVLSSRMILWNQISFVGKWLGSLSHVHLSSFLLFFGRVGGKSSPSFWQLSPVHRKTLDFRTTL